MTNGRHPRRAAGKPSTSGFDPMISLRFFGLNEVHVSPPRIDSKHDSAPACGVTVKLTNCSQIHALSATLKTSDIRHLGLDHHDARPCVASVQHGDVNALTKVRSASDPTVRGYFHLVAIRPRAHRVALTWISCKASPTTAMPVPLSHATVRRHGWAARRLVDSTNPMYLAGLATCTATVP